MADAPKLPPLIDFSYYTSRTQGGVGPEEIGTARAQNFLNALRQYDPNASFVPVLHGGYVTGYDVNFDASKLPGVSGSGSLADWHSGQEYGANFQPSWQTVNAPGSQWMNQISDPNAVQTSPIYGDVTERTNIKPQERTLLDILGPAAVGAFALAGGMGLLPSFGGNAAGAGAAGAGSAGGGASGGLFDMGPWSGTGVADMVPGTGLTDSLAGGGGLLGGGPALDTSGDSYLGLTDQGFPAFQGVPSNALAHGLVNMGIDPLRAGSLVSSLGGLGGIAGKLPGLLGGLTGGAPGGGGGGGLSLGGGGGGGGVGADITEILRRFYGIDQLEMAKALRQAQGARHG